MRVHRFMSDAEYEVLMAGGRLMNGTVHSDKGNKSTSVGFCFFTEDPDEAIHWLSGCCYPDWCVTLEFPAGYLNETTATYRDPKKDNLYSPAGKHKRIERKEYCTTQYDNRTAQVLSATQKYKRYAELRRDLEFLGML